MVQRCTMGVWGCCLLVEPLGDVIAWCKCPLSKQLMVYLENFSIFPVCCEMKKNWKLLLLCSFTVLAYMSCQGKMCMRHKVSAHLGLWLVSFRITSLPKALKEQLFSAGRPPLKKREPCWANHKWSDLSFAENSLMTNLCYIAGLLHSDLAQREPGVQTYCG